MAVLGLGVVAAGAGCARPDRMAPAEPSREFGVALDPWAVSGWARAVGAEPTMVMEFEPWAQDRTLDGHLQKVRSLGMTSYGLTWEPWASIDASLGIPAQRKAQPQYTNAAIAVGRQDPYVRAFAESVRRSGLTVYLRYAHEMNGNWYPWSADPAGYVQAWRHVVTVFREAGAGNAKFVFAPNSSLYVTDATWKADVAPYWPGDQYVDYLGITMINFGGSKERPVTQFADRVTLMHRLYGKPVLLAEVNTAAQGRVRWLTDLRTWLDTDAPWVIGMVLSQGYSRAEEQIGPTIGDMSWQVTQDSATIPVVRATIQDLSGSPMR